MKFYTSINWTQPQSRWVAYFDLLGFGDLTKEKDWPTIVDLYSKSLDEARIAVGKPVVDKTFVECVWFSDTFLFYTSDDSGLCFEYIRQTSRFFIRGLLQKGIPVSGALSCGEFFTDKTNQIYLGKALVDAAKYGERYNWIGFVLSPAAQTQMSKIGAKFPSVNFKAWEVEIKPKKRDKDLEREPVVAYALGNDLIINGKNFCYGALKEMLNRAPDDYVKRKCENTVLFLESFGSTK